MHVLCFVTVKADAEEVKEVEEVEDQICGQGANLVGIGGLSGDATGEAIAQLVGGSKKAISDAGAFLLAADLFIHIGREIFGLLIVHLDIDELVQDFGGAQVFTLIKQLPALDDDWFGTTHHFHIERRRLAR